MPRYQPSDEDMDEAMSARPQGGTGGQPKSVDQENAETDSKSAIVSMGVLMGEGGEEPAEGDTITVRLVKKYGDEAEIEFAGGETKPMPKGPPGSDMSDREELEGMNMMKG